MLRNTEDLEKFELGAKDGVIGKISDFYFDDGEWVIRYLIVDTGNWLSSRKVLISPMAVGKPEWWGERTLPVDLTRAQVEASPDTDTEQPVSRQQERAVLSHYGYPYYWGGTGLWGGGLYPYTLVPGLVGFGTTPSPLGQPDGVDRQPEANSHHDDPHLRSCHEVIGYHIHASDGEVGQVRGFLVDENTWAVRYMIVDTGSWWRGHEVLIAPGWIKAVEWSDNTVAVDMTRQALMDAPVYDSNVPFGRTDEASVHQHHGRTGYWSAESSLR